MNYSDLELVYRCQWIHQILVNEHDLNLVTYGTLINCSLISAERSFSFYSIKDNTLHVLFNHRISKITRRITITITSSYPYATSSSCMWMR